MSRYLLLCGCVALTVALLMVSPARADVACVQEELTKLGFDPGPVDGALGKRTSSAAALFATNANLPLEALSAANSGEWCEAITVFASTPAAVTISHYDLITEPQGILSARDQQGLWEAYTTASECFDHPTYGKGVPQQVAVKKPNYFLERDWSSPFTSVRGAKECVVAPGNLAMPEPISEVRLDEAYGERQPDVDRAATWFRRMTTYLRLSDDPIASTLLREAVVNWARGKGLSKGIHVSWGNRPVDYQMMATILALMTATAEVASDFSPEERAVVGPWLNDLVQQSAASFWSDRTDNKAYMRTYLALLWGLVTGDDRAVQDAIFSYKLAVHDMRPDGSWPIDTQRGAMGISYNAATTSHIVMMAIALQSARDIDLFNYEVEGRSVHDAVDYVVSSIKSPGEVNAAYAISCPEGGDRFGSIDSPSMGFLDETGYLVAYAARFPEREASKFIVQQFGSRPAMDSEKAGGPPACHFAMLGGEVTLEPLTMPAPPPKTPEAQYVVRTIEDLAHQTGRSTEANSLLVSEIEGAAAGRNRIDYNVIGRFSYSTSSFTSMNFVINEPLGDIRPTALADCGAGTKTYEDGLHRLVIDFAVDGTKFKARNADCIISALPDEQAFQAEFLLNSFQDIAIGLVASGEVDSLSHEGMKTFFRRVALGELTVGK